MKRTYLYATASIAMATTAIGIAICAYGDPLQGRDSVPQLPNELRERLLLWSSSMRMQCLDHPPQSLGDLQQRAKLARNDLTDKSAPPPSLRFAMNPEVQIWKSINAWDQIDARDLAVVCIDRRTAQDQFTLYHGLNFRDQLLIQTQAPPWLDHAIYCDE